MRRLLPVLLALILFAGCDSAGEEASTPLLPDDARYAWAFTSDGVDADSLLFGESTEVRVRTVSRNASVPGYRGLIEVETSTAVGSSRDWYESSSERLHEVAYISAGATPSATPRGVHATADVYRLPHLVAELVWQHGAARTAVDSLIVREAPRVVYELPLDVGASWVSFTEPFESTREVVGREVITVEAGTFDCFVIRTEIDIRRAEGESFEWLDYVSEEHGLVLRTIDAVQEHAGPDNEPTGHFFQSSERLELTAGG